MEEGVRFLRLVLSYDGSHVEVREPSTGTCHKTSLDEGTKQRLLQVLSPISSVFRSRGIGCCPPEREDVQEVGEILGGMLFAEPLTKILDQHLACRGSNPLRLELEIEDPYLRSLPWEVACLRETPACWREDVQVVRRGPPHEAPRGLAMAGTLQVLLVVEDPQYPQEEAWRFRQEMQQSKFGIHVAEPLVREGWEAVRKQLNSNDWHVIIYAGHVSTAGDEGYLSFADRSVSRGEFVEQVLKANDNLRCVVLLGCGTWDLAGQAFLRRGLPAVVGTHFYVPAGMPRSGLERFLEELASSGRVDQAYGALCGSWPREHRGTPVLSLGTDQLRLFSNDAKLVQLGDYMRALRDRLSRLESPSGRRLEELYQQRQLSMERKRNALAQEQKDREGERIGSSGDEENQKKKEYQSQKKDKGQDHSINNREYQAESELLRDLLRPHAAEKLCIVGDAGMGKSTLLDHLAWGLARRFLAQPEGYPLRVPFRMDLRDWNSHEHPTLQKLALDRARPTGETLMEECCRDGSAVFLLDGLDEVRPDRRRQDLVRWLDAEVSRETLRQCSVVLTSRPWSVEHVPLRRFQEKPLQLEAFGHREIEGYIQQYFLDQPDRARMLHRQVEEVDPIRRIVNRPLLLSLLCMVCEEGEVSLPNNEGELLERSLREMLRRRQLHEDMSLRLLQHIAWSCWMEEPSRQMTRERALEWTVEAVGKDPVLKAHQAGRSPVDLLEPIMEHSGILVEATGRACRFAKESYLEYLVGRHLAGQKDKTIIDLFGRHAWNPAWERIWRFMAGRMWASGRELLALRLVWWLANEHRAGYDDVLGRLICLAGRLLAAADAEAEDRDPELTKYVAQEIWGLKPREFFSDTPDILPPLQRLVSDLSRVATPDGSPEDRLDSVRWLGRLGCPQTAKPLAVALNDPSSHARSLAAMRAIDRVPETCKPLVEAVASVEHTVRQSAAEAMAKLCCPDAVPPLIAALHDVDDGVTSVAAGALGECGGPEAVEPLANTYRYEHHYHSTNRSVAMALCKLGFPNTVQPLAKRLRDSQGHVREASATALIMHSRPEATGALTEALMDPREYVRLSVVEALGSAGCIEVAKPLLMLALADTNRCVRFAAAQALSDLGCPEGVGPLVLHLADPNGRVRRDAAYALGASGAPEAAAPLMIALKDDDKYVRSYAARSLGMLGCEGAEAVLAEALSDPQWEVCVAAADALGTLGYSEALASLVKTLRTIRWEYQESDAEDMPEEVLTAHVLAALEGKDVPELQKCPRKSIQSAAAKALGQLCCPEAVEVLVEAMRDAEPLVREAAAEALGKLDRPGVVEALLVGLEAPESSVRQASAKALGELGRPEAAGLLVERLKDQEAGVRQAATEALGNLGRPEAVEPLGRVLRDRGLPVIADRMGASFRGMAMPLTSVLGDRGESVIRTTAAALCRALGDSGEHDAESFQYLITTLKSPRTYDFVLLRDSDVYVRTCAGQALGKLRRPEAARLLVDGLEDWHPDVRLASAIGLYGSDFRVICSRGRWWWWWWRRSYRVCHRDLMSLRRCSLPRRSSTCP
jgi:HEAT repeat protein